MSRTDYEAHIAPSRPVFWMLDERIIVYGGIARHDADTLSRGRLILMIPLPQPDQTREIIQSTPPGTTDGS